jgi:S1-C subfamily serine protease
MVLRRARRSGCLLLAVAAVAVAALLAGASPVGAAPVKRASATTGVVTVQTRLGFVGAAAAGTGMVLSPSGVVLTNNHVIRGATTIRVTVPSTSRTYPARVVGYDIADDVAVLQLQDASGLATVTLGDSSGIRAHQAVTAVGNAGGTGTLTTEPGTITAVGRSITVNDEQGGIARLRGLIETDAALRPGDSGGPLLDQGGKVIGMNSAASATFAFNGAGGEGYAIPVNRASAIATQIRAGRRSANVHIGATPFLGVGIEDQPDTTGGLVTAVASGSPADRAGVAAGDTIVSFDGRSVHTRAGLITLLLRKQPGAKARLAWLDQVGNRAARTITLASGPPQ